jgi:hypothetical protein
MIIQKSIPAGHEAKVSDKQSMNDFSSNSAYDI